jgi:hypothetical protein
MEAETGNAVLHWITALGTMAKATGDNRYLDAPDPDAVARVLHGAMVKLPSVIRDQDTIDKDRAARAQAIAQQQQIEQAAQLASIHADVAHANQAQTSSKARSAA